MNKVFITVVFSCIIKRINFNQQAIVITVKQFVHASFVAFGHKMLKKYFKLFLLLLFGLSANGQNTQNGQKPISKVSIFALKSQTKIVEIFVGQIGLHSVDVSTFFIDESTENDSTKFCSTILGVPVADVIDLVPGRLQLAQQIVQVWFVWKLTRVDT